MSQASRRMSVPMLRRVAAILAVALATTALHAGPADTSAGPARLARAGQAWLPRYDASDWNIANASPVTQATCKRSQAAPVPPADLPGPADLPALASCDSVALYYGDEGAADPVRARQCAYLERAGGDGGELGGSAMLAMIYANGKGVPRNLPLATKFACEAGGAPAEIDSRIEHLDQLGTHPAAPQAPFDFCDDITSGYMAGACAAVASGHADARREDALDQLTQSYDLAQRQALAGLRQAADAYFQGHAGNEVDLSGTARDAFALEDEGRHRQAFLDELKSLESDQLPAADATAARRADARLNAIYRRVLAHPGLATKDGELGDMGTIKASGIRADQRLWLVYRDAWLRFAAARKPTLSRDAVLAWITQQRVDDLRTLLPATDPDYRTGDD